MGHNQAIQLEQPTPSPDDVDSEAAAPAFETVELPAARRSRPTDGIRRRAMAKLAAALAVAVAAPAVAAVWNFGTWPLAAVAIVDLLALAGVVWVLFLRAGTGFGIGRGAMLAQSFDFAPAGLLIVNRQDQLVYANASYRRLVEAPASGPVPTLAEVVGPDPAASTRLAQMIRAVRPGHLLRQVLPVHRDGATDGSAWPPPELSATTS